MMESKERQIIKYKESFFSKIKNFFNKILFRKNKEQIEVTNDNTNKSVEFKENIILKENPEQQRILKLKRKYDNGEIFEDEISIEDMDSLINMYKEETKALNDDTEKRKRNIQMMLQEMREYKK